MVMANDFELPSASEKLSGKFILDALERPDCQAASASDLTTRIPSISEMPKINQKMEKMGTEVVVGAGDRRNEALINENAEAKSYGGVELAPGKKYFRIGEVADLIGVETHVLRYWESEFKSVRPTKTSSGQRVYSKRDVETLHYVRHLLHVDKFSIKGAKKKLNERKRLGKSHLPPAASDVFWDKRAQHLKQAAADLKEIIQILRHETPVA